MLGTKWEFYLRMTVVDLPNKRIALCFSGQARAVKYCFESIFNNLIYPLGKVDIFIHSWFIDPAERNRFDIFHLNLFDSSLDEYVAMYRPVASLFEDFDRSEYLRYNNLTERPRIMFYSMFKANELKSSYEEEGGFKYDYVIRARTDLLIRKKIHREQLYWLDDNSVLIPSGFDFGGINDQAAIGTSLAIDKYASMHKRLNEYLREGQQYDPERLMKHHLEKEGFTIRRVDLDYSIVKKKMKYHMGPTFVSLDDIGDKQ